MTVRGPMVGRWALAATLAAWVPRAAAAQDGQEARLAARLDRTTVAAVESVIDSARVAKLPTAPLVDKALEGAAKGSNGATIVEAVRQLSARLARARRALGAKAPPDEIKAAAAALAGGVSDARLARFRATAGTRDLTMPFAVVSDLIARGVAADTAAGLVLQLTRARARDVDLTLFQRNVRADVDRGADPTVAASTRARGFLMHSRPTTR